jgi:hypothetical protein
MAGLMTAPMILIEIALMWPIVVVAVIALAAFWIGIRQQVGVTHAEFLKSMIPHHSGAILMCEKASLKDGQIQALCQEIIRGQQAEIGQMKAILSGLD